MIRQCIPYGNFLSKVKKKFRRRYSRLRADHPTGENNNDNYDSEFDQELEDIHPSGQNMDDFHNEPIVQCVDDNRQKIMDTRGNLPEQNIHHHPLLYEEAIKRKSLLNKVYLLFENNRFVLDTYSIKKLQQDQYILHRCVKVRDPYFECYQNTEDSLIKEYMDNNKSMYPYEKRNKKDINYILSKYYIIFDHLNISNPQEVKLGPPESKSFKRTALCGMCMDHIQIYEYQCYGCGNTFFDQCEHLSHQKMNDELPLKQRFSNDFINHIKCCTLKCNYIINELYEYLHE